MAGRGPQSFKKRQKEQQRKEKQQEKAARRVQRKIDQENGIVVADDDDLDELDLEDGESAEEIADRAAGLVRQTESA
jgi:hypothetical protein